jgi:TonB family protein
LLAAVACGGGAPPSDDPAATVAPAEEPPVALNADTPILYPPALFDQKVEGSVVLRLFVDSTGRLSPESTKVAEASGYPALDSAAVAGAGKLRFAPAKRHGIPISTAFLQPIEFHHPAPGIGAPAGGPPAAAVTAAPTVVAPPPRPVTPKPQPDTTLPRSKPDTVKPPTDTIPVRTDTGAVSH